jgi:hypothetical protein
MCAAIELFLQVDDCEGNTEKVNRVTGPCQPPEKVKVKKESEINGPLADGHN